MGETVSVRHVAALIASLPNGSLTRAAIDPATQWGDTEWLLWMIANMLSAEKIPPFWEMTPKNTNQKTTRTPEELERRLSLPRKEVTHG